MFYLLVFICVTFKLSAKNNSAIGKPVLKGHRRYVCGSACKMIAILLFCVIMGCCMTGFVFSKFALESQ